ncbi:MAG: DNA-binding protein [Acidobacteriia bacterium]|nr:DNA-binding protein [Terriglobia bacterium]
MNPNGKFKDTAQSAPCVGLKPRTLEKLRCIGGGPEYYKLGRKVYYTDETLTAWAESRRRTSTSQ